MTQTLNSDFPAELSKQVVEWRRHLHRHPELSFQEHRTAQFVEDALRKLPNLTVSRPTPTSVLAVLKGQAGPGKTVLLRADMDALPIEEETGLDFASSHPGVMHACGHDGHTAMLLGAATLLSAQPEMLHGEVRFIFQHAEELPPGGAQELVDAGIMDGVDVVMGAHLMSPVPTGVVVVKGGPLMAAADRFSLTIQGKGGHGAMPHQTIDPVVIAAQVILALQTIVSRTLDPMDTAVVTVATLEAGIAQNVIPDTVTLGGTIRTFNPEVRQLIPERMEAIVKGITQAHGATYRFDYLQGYRATTNDDTVARRLQDVVRQVLPDVQLLTDPNPLMGSEDFSAYMTKAPGTFVLIGAGGPDAAPHHHPKFDVDEAALEHGVKVYVGAAHTLTR
ncbi:M20 family metallopeptidase [Deinococcus antarcticus]|uniref:M20 family metallopeptidase n=1 Tax=Deinococcus antarcticus TaxID=1298767 RepID=A0ABV8A3L9_9DEIO